MSATIGNMSDLAAFLEAEVYQGQFRPVQLREHVLLSGQLLEVTGPVGAAPPADPDDWRALLTPRRTLLFQVRGDEGGRGMRRAADVGWG